MRSARSSLRNGRPARWRCGGRSALGAILALLLFALNGSVARAEDATHWLTPSRHATSKGLLFEAGIPAQTESAVPTDHALLLPEGQALYDVHCATCHAVSGLGARGAPSLQFAGGAVVDFYISTGRMPLADKADIHGTPSNPVDADMALGTQAYHTLPLFDARQAAAIDAYVTSRAARSIPIPVVTLDPTKLQRGRLLYEDNCEACHGAGAQGATAGYQWTALPLNQATLTQIGEAIRIGPGVMPSFTPRQLSDSDVDAVATYVRYLMANPQTYGGAVMDYLGPISEGAVSAFIGVGFLFWVIYFTGTKANGRRFNEID